MFRVVCRVLFLGVGDDCCVLVCVVVLSLLPCVVDCFVVVVWWLVFVVGCCVLCVVCF